ncbi:MAG: hypothetical protein ACHP84_00860 [Caulobacterales bacterium]
MHARRCGVLAALFVLAATLLAGCSTLDITHPEEVAKWGTGGTALEGATYLTVYDNELKQLSAQSQAEDVSLAQRRVACRNAELAAMLDRPSPEYSLACPPVAVSSGGLSYAQAVLTARLTDNAGAAFDARKLSGLKLGMDQDDENAAIAQFVLDNARHDYAREHPAPVPPASPKDKTGAAAPATKPFDTSCEALQTMDAAMAKAAGADVVQMRCAQLANLKVLREKALASFLGVSTLPDCSTGPSAPSSWSSIAGDGDRRRPPPRGRLTRPGTLKPS